jgi:hypothetical protein
LENRTTSVAAHHGAETSVDSSAYREAPERRITDLGDLAF